MRMWSLASLLVIGCGDKDDTDTAADTDTGGSSTADMGGAAPLAELSSGECPDMSSSGLTSTFLSSGDERTVTLIYPSDTDQDMSMVFFFHGLLDPGHTEQPTAYMADALNAQRLADDLGAVIVMPQSPIQDYLGFQFFLWNVEQGTSESDLVLYDDLRTCMKQQFDTIDLDRVSAMGFSGGSLFATIVAGERGDTLASVVEMSGGADLEVVIADNFLAPYSTPASTMPSLLVTGGTNDVWPSASLTVVDFVDGTDTLEAHLVGDGHFTVRCRHDRGHTITNAELELAIDWSQAHTYETASPYETDGLGGDADWCEVVSQ
jgi:poly(3-hydroxybutyrate) depolymerase